MSKLQFFILILLSLIFILVEIRSDNVDSDAVEISSEVTVRVGEHEGPAQGGSLRGSFLRGLGQEQEQDSEGGNGGQENEGREQEEQAARQCKDKDQCQADEEAQDQAADCSIFIYFVNIFDISLVIFMGDL